jgi:hypothetical protein
VVSSPRRSWLRFVFTGRKDIGANEGGIETFSLSWRKKCRGQGQSEGRSGGFGMAIAKRRLADL